MRALFIAAVFTLSANGASVPSGHEQVSMMTTKANISPLVTEQAFFSCNVPHNARTDCGYLGTSKDDCETKGETTMTHKL